MMKKYLVLFIIIGVIVTGCNDDDAKKTSGNKKDDVIQKVNIDGEEIKLSYENNFQRMYYKENVVSFTSNTMSQQRVIAYSKGGITFFQIHIVYFKDKSIEEVMKETKYERTKKKINDLEYEYFEYPVNGRTGHTYVYNYEGTTYTINFVFEKDNPDFENIFMNNVYFK